MGPIGRRRIGPRLPAPLPARPAGGRAHRLRKELTEGGMVQECRRAARRGGALSPVRGQRWENRRVGCGGELPICATGKRVPVVTTEKSTTKPQNTPRFNKNSFYFSILDK